MANNASARPASRRATNIGQSQLNTALIDIGVNQRRRRCPLSTGDVLVDRLLDPSLITRPLGVIQRQRFFRSR